MQSEPTKAIERVPINLAIEEITQRLETVRSRIAAIHSDVTGHGHNPERGVETIRPNSLDAKISEMYPILGDIEQYAVFLMERIGVSDPEQRNVQTPQRSARVL